MYRRSLWYQVIFSICKTRLANRLFVGIGTVSQYGQGRISFKERQPLFKAVSFGPALRKIRVVRTNLRLDFGPIWTYVLGAKPCMIREHARTKN